MMPEKITTPKEDVIVLVQEKVVKENLASFGLTKMPLEKVLNNYVPIQTTRIQANLIIEMFPNKAHICGG